MKPAAGRRGATPLDRVPIGAGRPVVGVGAPYRADLALEGIRPGAVLRVSATAPFGGPVVVRIGRARVAVPRAVARTVEVSVEAVPEQT